MKSKNIILYLLLTTLVVSSMSFCKDDKKDKKKKEQQTFLGLGFLYLAANSGPFNITVNVTGLNGTVVLQNKGKDELSISADGSYSFPAQVAKGGSYDITVKTHPAAQMCQIPKEAASGTTNGGISINVACGKKPPTFTTFEPSYGNAGSKVVLIGKGFSEDLSKNEVFFNNEKANIVGNSISYTYSIQSVYEKLTLVKEFKKTQNKYKVLFIKESSTSNTWILAFFDDDISYQEKSLNGETELINELEKSSNIDESKIIQKLLVICNHSRPLIVIAPDTVNTGRISVKTDGSLPAYSNGNFTVLPSVSYPVTDTGITDCYSNTVKIPCTGDSGDYPRQDGDFIDVPNAPNFTGPTQHPTYTNNFTTKDNVTGLTWTSCLTGRTGSDCSSSLSLSAETNNNPCAPLNKLNNGEGFAGIKTWRLPYVEELLTIGTKNFNLDTAFFPDGLSNGSKFYAHRAYKIYQDSDKFFIVVFGDYRGVMYGINNDQYFSYISIESRCVAGS